MRSALVVVVCLAVPASARAAEPQRTGAAARASRSSTDGPDLFGGLSYLRGGEANLYGWHVSGSTPSVAGLRLVGDLSGHYGSFAGTDLSQLTFLAGLRKVFGRSSPRPFAHVLAGGVRGSASVEALDVTISESDTDWGGALGGGVDFRLADRWDLRLQGDYLLTRAEGAWEGDPRVSAGVVRRLGR